MKWLLFFIFIFNFLHSVDYFSRESIYDFANHLYEEGDYKGALLEYKRLLTLNKRNTNNDEIYYKIGLCYERLNNFEKAIENYKLI